MSHPSFYRFFSALSISSEYVFIIYVQQFTQQRFEYSWFSIYPCISGFCSNFSRYQTRHAFFFWVYRMLLEHQHSEKIWINETKWKTKPTLKRQTRETILFNNQLIICYENEYEIFITRMRNNKKRRKKCSSIFKMEK